MLWTPAAATIRRWTTTTFSFSSNARDKHSWTCSWKRTTHCISQQPLDYILAHGMAYCWGFTTVHSSFYCTIDVYSFFCWACLITDYHCLLWHLHHYLLMCRLVYTSFFFNHVHFVYNYTNTCSYSSVYFICIIVHCMYLTLILSELLEGANDATLQLLCRVVEICKLEPQSSFRVIPTYGLRYRTSLLILFTIITQHSWCFHLQSIQTEWVCIKWYYMSKHCW